MGEEHKINKIQLLSMALLLMVSVSAGFVGGWAGSEHRSNNSSLSPSSPSQQIVLKESEAISYTAKQVSPSVVSINVTSENTFGRRAIEQEGAGTGIIISADGYILTNRHVVPAGVTRVRVTLADGTELSDVDVVGRTNESDTLDVAFLKIKDKKGKELTAAKLGDSSKVQVGDKVVAIGNALGQFQNTVTAGIISGYGRSVEAGDVYGGSNETLQNLFQTDAAINEGNSGGPLVNISGEVIGINTAVAGGGQNIGFAIPINDVQGLIKSVLANGKLQRPYIGVRYISLTDDLAYQFHLSVKRGAYITSGTSGQPSVVKGSPADKAGLKDKDVITKIDGVAIDENNSLTSVIGKHSVGDRVTLTIIRDGKEQSIKLTLEAAAQS